MNVKTDLAVNKTQKKKQEPIVVSHAEAKPTQTNDEKTTENKTNDVVKNSVQQPIVTNPEPGSTHKSIASQSSNNENKKQDVVLKPEGKNNQTQETVTNTSNVQQKNLAKNNAVVTTKSPVETKVPSQKQPEIIQVVQKNNQERSSNEEPKVDKNILVSNSIVQQKEIAIPAAELPSFVANRKNETIQDISFKNDSLILSLYDNGIVDGDTVSVFMNGENIVSKQKLKESATKKTIYIPVNTDSLQLVLFAENLGTIPPNTGLLTIRDGDDIYQVRFSADLQTNASIILRRKK
jgi:hypothetical protein